MSTARWSLQLRRTLSKRHPVAPQDSAAKNRPFARFEQRRWLRNRPPPPNIPKNKGPSSQELPEGAENRRRDGLQENERLLEQNNQRQGQGQDQEPEQQPGRNTQLAETLAQSDTSDLVTEVHIPDDPNGILPKDHPARSILGNSSLVIQRQIEFMNLMIGFEQANKYIIMDGQGQTVGYIAEQDHGIGRAFARQLAKTHRSFTTHIFDRHERDVLRIHRPFAYINSRIRIYDPIPEGGYEEMETSTALHGTSASSVTSQGTVAQTSPLKLDEMRIIGEAQQQWAPLRRKYNLFSYRALEPPRNDSTLKLESGEKPTSDTVALTESKANDAAIEAGMAQFAHINEPFLSWDFTLRDEDQKTIGSVNRNFVGFAREIFTDTGVYALRMDSAAQSSTLETASGEEVAHYERDAMSLSLDQRAVMLALAVSIDFDYFSRHSHAGGGGGFMPIFWPMGGGAAEGGAAGAGAGAAGGAVGAAEGAGAMEGAAGAAGAASRGVGGAVGAGEGAIAGAGTMAGYEAMQRGMSGGSQSEDPGMSDRIRGPGAEQMAPDIRDQPFQGGNQAGSQPMDQGQSSPPDDGDAWGEGNDPWSGDGGPPSAGGEGGGGGGWLDTISDFFSD